MSSLSPSSYSRSWRHRTLQKKSGSSSASKVHLYCEKSTSNQYTLPRISQQKEKYSDCTELKKKIYSEEKYTCN